jgi:NAD(P)-dependent dehydrogenase (short-subunit alcohol dehydrogenase family)
LRLLLPRRVRPDLFTPADSFIPGQTPIQVARWPGGQVAGWPGGRAAHVGVVVGELAVQRVDKRGDLVAGLADGQISQLPPITLAADQSIQEVDVSDPASVAALAKAAADAGPVTTVVHTAGLSPVQAAPGAILAVDLLGTATVLDAFGEVITAGGAGVFISSMAGHLTPLPAEVERALSTTPTAELLALPFLSPESIATSSAAYGISKRANHLRVAAAAHGWGQRGARVNSISPGSSPRRWGRASWRVRPVTSCAR